jgi:hypothetical protein
METTLEGIYRIRIYKIKAGNVFVYTRGQRTRTKPKRELETEMFLVFCSFL